MIFCGTVLSVMSLSKKETSYPAFFKLSKPPNLLVLLVTTSFAPASPNAWAMARPMPLVPPVTIATLLVILNRS